MRQRAVGRRVWWIGFAFVGCVLSRTDVAAQSPTSGPLTLNDAIQLAVLSQCSAEPTDHAARS